MAERLAVRHARRPRVLRHRPRAERLLKQDIHSYLEYAAWLLPLFVAFVVRYEPVHRQQLAVGAIAALGVIAAGVQVPAVVIGVLVALLPFRDYVFACLYQLGVGADLLRPLSAWKELGLLILAVAAIRELRRQRQRIDWMDRFAIGLVGLVVLYYLIPSLGAVPTIPAARLLGLRTLGAFPALFLACRHIRLSDSTRERLAVVAMTSGTIAALSGIVNYVNPTWWRDFTLRTVHLDLYISEVQNAVFTGGALFDVGRPGGLLIFSTVLGAYLVIAVAIGAHRIAKGGASAGWYVATATCGLAIVLTASRGPALAAAAVILIASRRGLGSSQARVRYALLCVVAAIAAGPFLLQSNLVERSLSALSGSDLSAATHQSQIELSIDLLKHHPFGLGLGTGSEAQNAGGFSHTSESSYLAIATEIGVLALVPFVGMAIGLLRTRRRVIDNEPGSTVYGAETGSLAALAYAGGWAFALLGLMSLDWIFLSVAWTFWILAGVGLGPRPAAVER